MKRLVYLAIASLSVLAIHLPADAIEFRQIPSSHSQGRNGELPTLELSPQWGLHISFIPSGEVVQQVRVGDPSRIVVDFDAPLVSTQSDGRNSGPTVIFLRQIQRLDLDLRLTPQASRSQETPLTVITVDSSGRRRLHQFRILLNRATNFSTVEILPDRPVASAPPRSYRNLESVAARPAAVSGSLNPGESPQSIAQRLEAGLVSALSRQLITSDSELWNRLQNFLRRLRAGEQISLASEAEGIPSELIVQILSLLGEP